MYSSDNGIWSSPDKLAVSSDIGFPFPGMGFSEYNHSDDQQLKQNLGSQLCEQLLQEHQTKWLDYDMELKPGVWSPGNHNQIPVVYIYSSNVQLDSYRTHFQLCDSL